MSFPRMAARWAQGLPLLWAPIIATTMYGVKAIPVASASATTTSMPANATTPSGFRLSPDITHFVPSCALTCFESFIDINFNTSTCGSSPSLQCLCAHTGSTGYTIGEGATECIVAENEIGNCHGMNYGSQTVANAYGMCSNQSGAAPETHATLVATLIVESGSIIVATPTRTTATTRPTQNSTWTSSFVTPTSSTTTGLSTSSSTPSSTAIAAAPSKPNLSSAQIGGIAGGVAAAAVIAGLLALFVFLRRRHGFARMRDSWSPKRSQGSPGSLPISQPRYKEPKMMSFTRALGRYSRGGSARPATVGLAISPEDSGTYGSPRLPGMGVGLESVARSPGHQRLVVKNVPPSPPAQDSLPAEPPMSPGRAVSSFKFFPDEQRRSQGAFPNQGPSSQPKPNLTVAIPKRQSTATVNHMPFQGGRDSVVTEFAEDGEDSATGLGSAQIWRPPNTDPASASTYYVADKWGNWVLGGTDPNFSIQEPIAELATPISKTAEEREAEQYDVPLQDSNAVKAAQRELASPKRPEPVVLSNESKAQASRSGAGTGKSTIRLVTPDSGRLPVNSRSSSVYSNYSLPQSVVPTAENPLPISTTTSGAEAFYTGRDEVSKDRSASASTNAPQKRRSDRRAPPERQVVRDSAATVMSQESATTIIADSPVEAVAVAVFPLPTRTSSLRQQRQSARNLSPVVESPGRSPVTYPDIPRSQSNNSINENKPRDFSGGKRPLPNHSINENKRDFSGGKRPLPNPIATRLAVQRQFSDSPTLGDAHAAMSAQPAALLRNVTPTQNQGGQGRASPPAARGGNASPIPPRPDQKPRDRRSGSPNMQGEEALFVQKKRGPVTDRARLPSQTQAQVQSTYGPLSIYDAYNDPSRPGSTASRPPLPPSMYAYGAAPSQQQQQQQQVHKFTPSPLSSALSEAMLNSSATYSGGEGRGPGSFVSSGSSVSSGLLAKRLGAERAAGFQQIEGPRRGAQPQQPQQRGWARRSPSMESGASASDARSLTPRGVVVRGVEGPRAEGARETYVQLPATPGWQPQLTPKKRGEDLYLSVK